MSDVIISRRKFIVLASSFVAMSSSPSLAKSTLSKIGPRFSSRKLSLYNIHSHEDFDGVYWREGIYDEKALTQLAHLLRDRRSGQQHQIDPQLFDVLHRLQSTLGIHDPYQIVCGYRSKETNAKLHRKNKGVAKRSRHMMGKAVDVRLQHTKLKELRDAAKSLKAGGVGYYPKSNFVHIDVRPKPTYW